jgi:hypothetical protein
MPLFSFHTAEHGRGCHGFEDVHNSPATLVTKLPQPKRPPARLKKQPAFLETMRPDLGPRNVAIL